MPDKLNPKKKIYLGILHIDDYECLDYGKDEGLIEQISNDWKKGDNVSISYFLSDKTLFNEEDARKNKDLEKNISGIIDDLDFVLEAYTIHDIQEYNESFIINGYDLFKELQNSEGKFLMLIIKEK